MRSLVSFPLAFTAFQSDNFFPKRENSGLIALTF